MASWRTQGYVGDSEDTESVSEKEVEIQGYDGITQPSPHPQGFYSIDDFVDVRNVAQLSTETERNNPYPFLHEQNNDALEAEELVGIAQVASSAPLRILTDDIREKNVRHAEEVDLKQYQREAVSSHKEKRSFHDRFLHEITKGTFPLDSSSDPGSDLTPALEYASTPITSASKLSLSSRKGSDFTSTHLPDASDTLTCPQQQDRSRSHSKDLEVQRIQDPQQPTRSLRTRNPIQVHPYLLEGERYRQSLKARGLKPVKIQDGQQSDTENSQFSGEGSSRSESGEKHQTLGPFGRRVSITSSSSSRLQSQENDEFPDIYDFPDQQGFLVPRNLANTYHTSHFARKKFKRQRLEQRQPLAQITGNRKSSPESDTRTLLRPTKIAKSPCPTPSWQTQKDRSPSPRYFEPPRPHYSTRSSKSATSKDAHPTAKERPRSRPAPLKKAWHNIPSISRPAQLESTSTRYRDRRRRPRPTVKDQPTEAELPENWPDVSSSSRPGQLESTTTRRQERRPRSRSTFEGQLTEVELQQQNHMLMEVKLPLSRFLRQPHPASFSAAVRTGAGNGPLITKGNQGRTTTFYPPGSNRVDKDAPSHTDTNRIKFRQPSNEVVTLSEDGQVATITPAEQAPTPQMPKLHTSSFSTEFDVKPLELGTYFHERTFIGSGALYDALHADYVQRYESRSSQSIIHYGGQIFRWGPWNETVSTELGQICRRICDLIGLWSKSSEGPTMTTDSLEIGSFLRSITHYFSSTLFFSDPVDRPSFLQRSSYLLQELQNAICCAWRLGFSGDISLQSWQRSFVQISTVLLVLSYEIHQMACGPETRLIYDTVVKNLELAVFQLFDCLNFEDLSSVRRLYLENQDDAKREAGIRDGGYIMEGIVVTMHILGGLESPAPSFSEVLSKQLLKSNIDITLDASELERPWISLFSLLPLQDFDERGVLKIRRRFQHPQEGWGLVRRLVGRLLSIYRYNLTGLSRATNNYCRTIYARCHSLMVDWGWQKCDFVIGTLFDFFACNGLAHLKHEDGSGSVRFLENLGESPDLSVDPRDRCFHIFLKTIAVGVKRLRSIYPESKIRNITFRLMPNHGRQYPKEISIRQEELDALRNHHDLLATLYWVSPISCRPSVSILRDLVDVESSHPAACQVNLRAWLNLVRYQLSSEEPVTLLQPFSEWYSTFMTKVLKQHESVRVEAEAHFTTKPMIEGSALAVGMLNATVAMDQKRVESVISDALLSLDSAITASRYVEATVALMCRTATADIFSLFEARKWRTDKLIIESLNIVKKYVQSCTNLSDSYESQQTSEESQDYGDWSAFVEEASIARLRDAAEHLHATAYDGLARLLSNAFGADDQPDDPVLLAIVDAWIGTIGLLVSTSLKQWDEFVGSYSRHSWTALRNTEQTRKYTAYFMAKVVQADPGCYLVHRSLFLSYWFSCLVERDSLLKFQHVLTNTVLNTDRANPLLKNLPFWFSIRDATYSITLDEIFQRRLSLISSVLTNMRESVEHRPDVAESTVKERREEYTLLLKRLMTTMKTNYQELQQSNVISGAYVEFVQRVVEYLQQYTVDICPVDKYFTDSTTFPLPEKDPTYVVGTLKNYGLKLSGTSVHRQLVSFIQSVSTRAVIDGKQSCLAMQLADAMVSTPEHGDEICPTLRAFLMKAIFPVYIEYAFSKTAGWMLVRPILEAITRMFHVLLEDVDATNTSSTKSVVGIMDIFLDGCRRIVLVLVEQPSFLDQARILHVLTLLIDAVTASLSPLDYLHRSSGEGSHAIDCAIFLYVVISFFERVVRGDNHIESPLDQAPSVSALQSPAYAEVGRFCSQELQQSLEKDWTVHGGQHYFARGNQLKPAVAGQVGRLDDERIRLLQAIDQFRELFLRMGSLAGRRPSFAATLSSRRKEIARRRAREKMVREMNERAYRLGL